MVNQNHQPALTATLVAAVVVAVPSECILGAGGKEGRKEFPLRQRAEGMGPGVGGVFGLSREAGTGLYVPGASPSVSDLQLHVPRVPLRCFQYT